MSWAEEHENTLRELGELTERKHDFTWRRPHTLQSAGKVPAALAVKVAALAGVSSLTLYAGAGLSLEGEAWTGLILVHGGNNYTLSADTTATGAGTAGQIVVTFTPVLAAGGASIDDAVTLPGTVDKTERLDGVNLWGVRSELRLDPLERGSFGEQGFAFSIPKNSAPLTLRPGHRIKIVSPALEGEVIRILSNSAPKWVAGVKAA